MFTTVSRRGIVAGVRLRLLFGILAIALLCTPTQATGCTAPTSGSVSYGNSSGIIQSDTDGAGPEAYGAGESCFWYIRCPEDTAIQFTVDSKLLDLDSVVVFPFHTIAENSTEGALFSQQGTRDAVATVADDEYAELVTVRLSAIAPRRNPVSPARRGFTLNYSCASFHRKWYRYALPSSMRRMTDRQAIAWFSFFVCVVVAVFSAFLYCCCSFCCCRRRRDGDIEDADKGNDEQPHYTPTNSIRVRPLEIINPLEHRSKTMGVVPEHFSTGEPEDTAI